MSEEIIILFTLVTIPELIKPTILYVYILIDVFIECKVEIAYFIVNKTIQTLVFSILLNQRRGK